MKESVYKTYDDLPLFLNVNLVAQVLVSTPPETVPLDRTNGALRPLKWCMVTAVMVH